MSLYLKAPIYDIVIIITHEYGIASFTSLNVSINLRIVQSKNIAISIDPLIVLKLILLHNAIYVLGGRLGLDLNIPELDPDFLPFSRMASSGRTPKVQHDCSFVRFGLYHR